MIKDSIVRKITAPNPGVFTGDGTNSYLVGVNDITLVDPGPAISEHIDNLINLCGNKLNRIFVTHTHNDHSPAAKIIADKLKIPVYGNYAKFSNYQDTSFKPDFSFDDKMEFDFEDSNIVAIHTPGHASNHFCFYIKQSGCLITGDHIMSGSTVVIGPPDGNMHEYIQSLKKLKEYKIKYIAPGHGSNIDQPNKAIDWIINHRLKREEKVLDKMIQLKHANLDRLVKSVYDDVDVALHPIAKASLEAHLIKLELEKKVLRNKDEWIYSEGS